MAFELQHILQKVGQFCLILYAILTWKIETGTQQWKKSPLPATRICWEYVEGWIVQKLEYQEKKDLSRILEANLPKHFLSEAWVMLS